MSFEAMTWALEQPVGGNDKLVLLLIANRIHKDQGFCWPKIHTIAEEAGISYSTVQRCIGGLIERGFMTVQRTHNQDGYLGGYRFYMAHDKISPGWEKFRREGRPTGQNDRSSPTGQNDHSNRSNCDLGTGQNDRTKPIRLTSKRTSKNTPIVPVAANDMDSIWSAYPSWRRGSRKPVEAALRSAIKRGAKVADILDGIRRAVAYWPKAAKESRSNFIPNLTTFLNQDRWTVKDEEHEANWSRKEAPRHQSAADRAEEHAMRMMQDYYGGQS